MNQLQCTVPTGDLLAQCRPKQMGVTYAITDDTVEIFLHGIIGDEYTQTDSLSVARILAENRGKAVNMDVNSPGGLAYDGVAIFNAIKAHNGKTTGTISGQAGSAASLAVVACDVINCYPVGVFQPHYSMVMAFGHQADLQQALGQLVQLDKDLETVYVEASGQTLEKVQADLIGPHGDGTVFGAQAAVDAGYVHKIIQHNKQKPAAAATSKSTALAARCVALLELELDRQIRSL